MLRLRKQVDQIDQKILHLLQQRTKISAEIGETKRQHGKEVYAPARERALMARLLEANSAASEPLPPRALAAIFREIISSSRAAQGQAPIGLLKSEKPELGWIARAKVGASDQIQLYSSWKHLAEALKSGQVAFALLRGASLITAIGWGKQAETWAQSFTVAGDIPLGPEASASLNENIYIVTSMKEEVEGEAFDRILILMECKSTANAVKTLLNCMSPITFQLNQAAGPKTTLWQLTASEPPTPEVWLAQIAEVAARAKGLVYVVGFYLKTQTYGG